jgi:DNA processing protein
VTSHAGKSGGIRLSDEQRIAWLRLIRSENVGPATFRDLVNHFGSASTALAMVPELTRRGGAGRPARVTSVEEAERELEGIRRLGARLVGIGEPEYPPLLRQSDGPPPLVTIKGDPAVFTLPAVAIVGARNASLAGIKFARKIAGELGEAGFCVVSGLARGIDAAAHEASQATGTAAALAGGLDKPYPPENMHLYKSIPEMRGALITEMPLGWEPRARDFPRRNRIIAALALGLVVVEAAERSGSLISARLAAELGRLVFAVPGSPLDPRARGTNGLLKNGAIVATETNDIISAIAPLVENMPPPRDALDEPDGPLGSAPPPSDDERDRILEALGPTPVAVDEIIRHTGLHPSQVFLVLIELDLAGRLERHPGGGVSIMFPDR